MNASLHFFLFVSCLRPSCFSSFLLSSPLLSCHSERVSFPADLALFWRYSWKVVHGRGSLTSACLPSYPRFASSSLFSPSFLLFSPLQFMLGVLISFGFTSHLNLETSFETASRRLGRVGVQVDQVAEGLSYAVAFIMFCCLAKGVSF